jgi:hypothetical protein
MVASSGYRGTGRTLGVSDNAVRNHLATRARVPALQRSKSETI